MSTQRVGLPERGAPAAMRALRREWGLGPRGGTVGGYEPCRSGLANQKRASVPAATPHPTQPTTVPGSACPVRRASLGERPRHALSRAAGQQAAHAWGQDLNGKPMGLQRPSAWANPFQEGSCRASAPFLYAIPGFFFCGKRQREGAAGCDVVRRGRNGQDRCKPDPLPRGTPKLRTRSSERPRRGMDGAC